MAVGTASDRVVRCRSVVQQLVGPALQDATVEVRRQPPGGRGGVRDGVAPSGSWRARRPPGDEEIVVRFDRRSHNPILREAALDREAGPIPWLRDRRKDMRKARSPKRRPSLLADLERRYRESPVF